MCGPPIFGSAAQATFFAMPNQFGWVAFATISGVLDQSPRATHTHTSRTEARRLCANVAVVKSLFGEQVLPNWTSCAHQPKQGIEGINVGFIPCIPCAYCIYKHGGHTF